MFSINSVDNKISLSNVKGFKKANPEVEVYSDRYDYDGYDEDIDWKWCQWKEISNYTKYMNQHLLMNLWAWS